MRAPPSVPEQTTNTKNEGVTPILPLTISPPWHTKPLTMRWNFVPLKCSGFPLLFPFPRSPVHKHLKFSQARGAASVNSSMVRRPALRGVGGVACMVPCRYKGHKVMRGRIAHSIAPNKPAVDLTPQSSTGIAPDLARKGHYHMLM